MMGTNMSTRFSAVAAMGFALLSGCTAGQISTEDDSASPTQAPLTSYPPANDCRMKIDVQVACGGKYSTIQNDVYGDWFGTGGSYPYSTYGYNMCALHPGQLDSMVPAGCSLYNAWVACNYRCDESEVFGPHCPEANCGAAAPPKPTLQFTANHDVWVTSPPGTPVTYAWSSSNATSIATSLTIVDLNNPSLSGRDDCGNQNTSNVTSFPGLNGSLGPLQMPDCATTTKLYTFTAIATGPGGSSDPQYVQIYVPNN